MATAKKKKKKTVKRRVGARGGKGSEILMLLLGVAGGSLLGRFAAGFQTFVKGILLGVLQVGVGVFIAYKVKSPLLKGVGVGLATNGLVYSLGSKGLALLPASVGEVYFPQPAKVAGYADVPMVGRFPSPASVGENKKGGSPYGMNRNDYMARIYGGVYTRN